MTFEEANITIFFMITILIDCSIYTYVCRFDIQNAMHSRHCTETLVYLLFSSTRAFFHGDLIYFQSINLIVDQNPKLRIQLSKEHETELKERGLLQHHKIAALAKVQVEKEKTKQRNANNGNNACARNNERVRHRFFGSSGGGIYISYFLKIGCHFNKLLAYFIYWYEQQYASITTSY